MRREKNHELLRRILFTMLILAIYMVGRNFLLLGVDSTAYQFADLDSHNLMMSMISGDRHRYTVFALGIMPAIMASLVIQLFLAIKGSEYRAKFSPQKIEKITIGLLVVFAIAFSIMQSGDLIFKEMFLSESVLRVIAIAEMTLGAIVIYIIANLNKDHGIGGQSILIFVNVLDTLITTVTAYTLDELSVSLCVCAGIICIILFMENKLIKIPVQRVSIHNIYADKNYIAFKLNPIGVMPVMFTTTFFMIPQMILSMLLHFFKDNDKLNSISVKMNLTDPLGVSVYLGIVFALTILFAFVMLAPGEIAEQLQKNGDSIVGVYAGTRTKKYIKRKLLKISVISGIVLTTIMGISLGLSLGGKIPFGLAMLPATVMILVGLICNLYQEIKTYKIFDSYKFFI